MHQVQATFRLDPLWSGPASGEWVPDPEVVKSETALFLAKHRAGRPPAEWSLEAGWKRPDGAVERRTLRVRGRQLRIERQEAAGVVAEVWDGERGWRVGPSGGEEPLPAAKRDVLAGTAEALFAVATEGAEAKLPQCELAGGEWLAGRMVAKLEVKDRAGRRRLVYLDPATGALAGLAYQDESNAWVEEAWVRVGDRLDLVRVDFDSGAPRERATGATLTAGPQDAALFKRAGQ